MHLSMCAARVRAQYSSATVKLCAAALPHTSTHEHTIQWQLPCSTRPHRPLLACVHAGDHPYTAAGERLEFYGDALIKLAVTCALWLQYRSVLCSSCAGAWPANAISGKSRSNSIRRFNH